MFRNSSTPSILWARPIEILAAPDDTLIAEAATKLDAAQDALDRALALRADFSLARLERARVYRLQARVLRSQQKSRDALNELQQVQRDVTESGDAIHVAAHFLRAAIFIDLHPDGPAIADATASANTRPPTNPSHEDSLPSLTWDSTLRDLAVFTDSAQASGPQHREHPDRARALNWLADYANTLGCRLIPCEPSAISEAWEDVALTRDSVQRAIDYFSFAQSAVDAAGHGQHVHPQFVETYVHLGKARTHMAGLLGSRATANFGCVPEVANEAMLNQALSDLRTAVDGINNDDDRDGRTALACALLALDQSASALAEASAAASPASTASAPSLLVFARVLAAGEEWDRAAQSYEQAAAATSSAKAKSLIYLERARAQLHTPPQQTISDDALDLAQPPQVTAAQASLVNSTNHASTNWVAHLELGKLYYRLGESALAQGHLAAFDAGGPAAAIDDRGVRAQALLFLSRIRSRPPLAHAANATRNADDAFAIDGSWPYREQACLARLAFGRVTFSESGPRAICSPGEDSPPGEGSLLEGMYHLRRAFLQRTSDREREWEDAYRAFAQGLRAIENIENTDATRTLRDRLQYGMGTAQYCIGFAELGNEAIQAIGDQARIDDARLSFANPYGIADCPARR